MQGVDDQRPHIGILRNAHRTSDRVLQQGHTELEALGTMVKGQLGQDHHRSGIGHIASHVAGGRLM